MFPIIPLLARAATAIASSLRAAAASAIRSAIKKTVSSTINTIVKTSTNTIVSDALGPEATRLLKEAQKALKQPKTKPKTSSPKDPEQQSTPKTQKTVIPKETRPATTTPSENGKVKAPVPKTSLLQDGESEETKHYVWQDALGVNQPDTIGTKDSIYFKLSQEEKQKLWDAYNNGYVEPYELDGLREFGVINFI